jgi:anti-sigma regulatory factor (Ser/Thr protein kinase)
MRETFSIEGGDFRSAGRVSGQIKNLVRQLGLPPAVVRRVAIASYEAEMNIVMYADRGVMTIAVTPDLLYLRVRDQGQGIQNIALAMQEGYSTATPEMREMGFGAGMGLPNIKSCARSLDISTKLGQGTTLRIAIPMEPERICA